VQQGGVGEIRHLISRLLLITGIALDHLFNWSLWRRLHQAAAKVCRWQKHRREPRKKTQL
jgi:hypothetical protein